MKLAYLATSKIPSRDADSVHVMKMCNALKAHGIDVTMYTPDEAKTTLSTDEVFDYYGIDDKFTVNKVSLRFPRLKRMKSFRYSFSTYRRLRKCDYDYIYGRDIMACAMLACITHKPVIIECHSHMTSNPFEHFLFKRLIKSKCLSKIVVITQALKDYFVSNYSIDDGKFYIAPDGADAADESTEPAKLISRSEGKLHVGYIGQLYKGRGVDVIIKLLDLCPFAFFHVVGGEETDIEFWTKEAGKRDNIHFYGFVPPRETVCFGKSMDVLIAPYKKKIGIASGFTDKDNTANWMSPMKIFEYMALGKPIIASDLPVIKEVLADGVNAVLCPPEDTDAWGKAVGKLYKDKKFSKTIAQNALSDFEQYTWYARAENLLKNVIVQGRG